MWQQERSAYIIVAIRGGFLRGAEIVFVCQVEEELRNRRQIDRLQGRIRRRLQEQSQRWHERRRDAALVLKSKTHDQSLARAEEN